MVQRFFPNRHWVSSLILLICLLYMASSALTQGTGMMEAEEEDEEAEETGPDATPSDLYVALEPEFVLNYGQESRLSFARIEVTVVAENVAATNDISHHAPALRHIVVMTITGADRQTVTTPDGRRRLRDDLRTQMRDYLSQETDDPLVSDVLFRNFIVQ